MISRNTAEPEPDGRFDESGRVPVRLELWVTLDALDWAGERDLRLALNAYIQTVGDKFLGHVQLVDIEVDAA